MAKSIRPRHISTRPGDEPIFTSPTGMDFEKRRIIFPPGFIDEIVLKGGDEYVKAEDIQSIISAVVKELRIELRVIMLHLASISDENIEDKDAD